MALNTHRHKHSHTWIQPSDVFFAFCNLANPPTFLIPKTFDQKSMVLLLFHFRVWSSNQNTVFIGDNNLIGHYFKYNDKILIWKYFDHKARIEWNNPKWYKNTSIKNPHLMEIIISLATPSSTLYYILFLPWLACGRMLLPMTELNSNCCLRQLRTLATLVGWVNGILLTITAGCSSEHPLISFI